MKKYYQTLNKKQKSKIKEQNKQENQKTNIQVRLTRLLVYAIVGYLFSIFIIVDMFLRNTEKTGSIIIASTLFLASTFFLWGRFKIKLDLLNKIALKK